MITSVDNCNKCEKRHTAECRGLCEREEFFSIKYMEIGKRGRLSAADKKGRPPERIIRPSPKIISPPWASGCL